MKKVMGATYLWMTMTSRGITQRRNLEWGAVTLTKSNKVAMATRLDTYKPMNRYYVLETFLRTQCITIH